MRAHLVAPLLVSLLLSGCGSTEPPAGAVSDAGNAPDAGELPDAGGTTDAGPSDAGQPPACDTLTNEEDCTAAGCRALTCGESTMCTEPATAPCAACPTLVGCDAPNTEACAAHHGALEACNATEGCSYFSCGFGGVGGCFDRTTAGCAVCPQTYGACPSCADFAGDAQACRDSSLGCRVLACAPDECHPATTTPCEACPGLAGCAVENTAACAAAHGDVDACDAADCAHYGCGFAGDGACFPRGSDGCAICPEVYCE